VFGGVDYQLSQSWVAGLLADGDWTSIRGRALNVNASAPTGGTADLDARRSWAAGGRLGYLVNPATLTYVNGGYTEAEFRGSGFVDAATGAPVDLHRPDNTYKGYFLGGGVEYVLAPGWSAKTEYRYASYTSAENSLIITSTGAPSNTIERNQPVVHTVIGGISYKFGWDR
jgi:outer membrane immunogenic protein